MSDFVVVPPDGLPIHQSNTKPPAPSLAGQSTPRSERRLTDRFGRVHRSLRVSVTDACNIRCQYCMPAEHVQFLARQRLLSFEGIEAFVRAAVACGITKVRITGGEPLLRPQLHQLFQRLSRIAGLDELAMTTNGMLLEAQVEKLVAAGLQKINISLDTLSESTFQQLSRREGLQRVLDGIDAALNYPQLAIKLNALLLRDVNLTDLFDLIDYAAARGLPLRFIEFMPLDSDRKWSQQRMVSGQELRGLIEARYGTTLRPIPGSDPSQPSVDYELTHPNATTSQVGFIDSVSKPFCGACDRLRLTAEGKIRNCLFGSEEWDVAQTLRQMADAVSSQVPPDAEGESPTVADLQSEVQAILHASIQAKHASHGIADPNFQPPRRAMYQIGG